MLLKTRISGKTYVFSSLNDVLAKASEEKSGDVIMGIAATSETERVAARVVLSEVTVADLRNNPSVPYETDEVTRVSQALVDEIVYERIKGMSIGALRDCILAHETSGKDIAELSRGLTPECIAATAKLMSSLDLVYAAKKIRIPTTCATTIGLPGTLSSRVQPNHPADEVPGILASAMEGLSYGQGDAVLGVNPVDDGVDSVKRILEAVWELMQKWEIPTQNCVLAHVTTQMRAVRQGAPSCMLFQSVAGTEPANKAFGIDANLITEAYDLIMEMGAARGPNRMYFETGQGAEMSINTACGVDMMTLEARCYAFCKAFHPFMVNNVSGFIGSETLYDGRQVIRASLEDHFMGKLTGLPMGVAPCYTNHTPIDQNDQETATMLLAMAGANFFMALPMGDDVMLAYQDTSYHDNCALRELAGLLPAPEFHKWLIKHEIMDEQGKLTAKAGDASMFAAR